MTKSSLENAPSLLVDAVRHFTSLMQSEMRLAKAEMSQIAGRAAQGMVFLAVAFLMALVALNVLASAAVAYIAATGFSVGLAALIVGGVLIAIALGCALAGKSRLSAEALTPTKTAQNLREDISTVKEASGA